MLMHQRREAIQPCHILLLIFYVLVNTSKAKTISYTADGNWSLTKALVECDAYLCTPSRLTWVPKYQSKLFNNITACDALVSRGIRKILFHGDSYMRQIYAAMLITLNGNFRDGSIANATLAPHCQYHAQFFEKKCNTRQLNHNGVVCDGRITLDPVIAGFGDLNRCSSSNGSVVLWSFGNYKLQRHGRAGVNNATAYSEFFQKDICPSLRQRGKLAHDGEVSEPCSVWWVSTHYRVKAYFDDEQPQVVKDYNYGMRKFFDRGDCGSVNYIDVYNMTLKLALNHSADAGKMTYDGVHWGFEINLVKAQIIINALTSQP
jgi:hypothetical protein